ncbi:MAG: hypothetical protein ACYDH5_13815 [Acidimicrobiales bacterium]
MSSYIVELGPEATAVLRAAATDLGLDEVTLLHRWVHESAALEQRRPAGMGPAVWERTRAAVEKLVPQLVAKVSP